MLFLLLVALHNIRWGARASSPLSLSFSRVLILIFMSCRVGEHYDFDVAYLRFKISRNDRQLYFR